MMRALLSGERAWFGASLLLLLTLACFPLAAWAAHIEVLWHDLGRILRAARKLSIAAQGHADIRLCIGSCRRPRTQGATEHASRIQRIELAINVAIKLSNARVSLVRHGNQPALCPSIS